MGKLHVLLKKEDINHEKNLENKIIVVFDILLATTTITEALQQGAKEVIPVLNEEEARNEVLNKVEGNYVLIGENYGLEVDGFLFPDPLKLKGKVENKTVVLVTTNGTIALKNSLHAKKVYAASLLNSTAVVKRILENYKDETILLVCSGSAGSFNVEDFYGAGYFLHCIFENSPETNWEESDTAIAAYQFYKGLNGTVIELLKKSRVGRAFDKHEMSETLEFAASHDIYSIAPYIKGRKYLVIK